METSFGEMKKPMESIVNELKKIKKVKAVYLFGSFAKNRGLPFSDIDLCAIAEKGLSAKERAEIVSLSSKKVQVSIFDDLPIYIKFEVIKGKPLFIRDKEFLHQRIFHTLKEYYDFQPLLKRFEEVYGVAI